MDKKTIIAILLVAALWIVFFIFNKPGEKRKKPVEKQPIESVKDADKDTAEKAKKGTEKTEKKIEIAAPKGGGVEKTATIKTKKYNVELTNKGAAIKSIKYLERNIELTVAAESEKLKSKGKFDFSLHFDEDEFQFGNALDNAIWNYRDGGGNRIIFSTNITINGKPVAIEKIYDFSKDGYQFRVEYLIKNKSWQQLQLKENRILVSPSDMLGPDLKDYGNRFNLPTSIYYMDGDFETSQKGGGGGIGGILGCGGRGSKEPLAKESGSVNWIGVNSRYFSLVMIPEEFTGKGVIMDKREKTGYRTGMSVQIKPIDPGKEVKRSFTVYLGEKDREKLASVDKSIIKAEDVNKIIWPIRWLVLKSLIFINDFLGNMGWALVIFSILTKLIFMPLTIKSTESMKKMQQLTPQLNEIKAKYKDKPQELQKEMMKLYREKGVNPMGGCFPILLQMPFFFALYSALINSIELWHAPFILWMKDLSMPDTVGTLPLLDVPLNILPLVMTITTFLQQRLTTVETGGQQQKIMMMVMPVVLLVIFWTMPSGLVLYWALQNILQVGHQLFVNYRGKKKSES